MVSTSGGRHARRTAARVAWWSRHSKWLLALAGVLIVAAGAIVAFALAPQHPPAGIARRTPLPANPPTASPGTAGLAADFAQLQSQLHAKTGVVLRPVGEAPRDPVILGDWSSGPAWSTIKVPLVIAALRQQDSDQITNPMIAAITESDNAAAESIWEDLGDPATAAAKVETVLRDTGDPTTVQSRKVRPEYTAFGQTDWSLTNQVRFLAAAACDLRDKPVLAMMGEVNNDQRWGMGTMANTKIKGGWGPSLAGRYLVRQIAIVPTPQGLTVVATAAEPESGSFVDGTQDLTEVARWLQSHLRALPAAQCST